MLDYHRGSLPNERFAPSELATTFVHLAYLAADEGRIRAEMELYYRASSPKPAKKAARKALAERRAVNQALYRRLEAAQRGAPALITVQSSEPVCKPHWFQRAVGILLGATGIVALAPIPVVVANAIYESEMLERVYEDPSWGLVYGFGVVAAALAVHPARECLTSERARRTFDLGLYAGAGIAAVNWGLRFGPTFFNDPLADYEAAAESAASLAGWYGSQLLLEFFGGAACLNGASVLLTGHTKRVSAPNEEHAALGQAAEAPREVDMHLAVQEDEFDAEDEVYESDLAAFLDSSVRHVEVATKLLAAKAAEDARSALAEVRQALIESITEEGEIDA